MNFVNFVFVNFVFFPTSYGDVFKFGVKEMLQCPSFSFLY